MVIGIAQSVLVVLLWQYILVMHMVYITDGRIPVTTRFVILNRVLIKG